MSTGARGVVIAQHGRLSRVKVGADVLVVPCRRNLLWESGRPEAAQVVVGDRVVVQRHRGREAIVAVEQRRSSLQRQAPGRRGPQLIASNVDQALVVMAARLPEPKQGLLDRFLVACHLAEIEAVVVINKSDQGLDLVAEWVDLYRDLGYTVLVVSALTGHAVGEVIQQMAGRTTLLCGPSGAGKSSLLNAACPGLQLRTGEVSASSGKGRHTTSRAELLPLPDDAFVVDTPGLKELGIWDAGRIDLEIAFGEIHEVAEACRYSDCSHTHEPGCAVDAAVDAGGIDPGRFASYLSMLADLQT